MAKPTDIRAVAARLYFLPHELRMPLKFGPETVTCVTCARASVTVADGRGRTAEGWGETPLSVQWVWPSTRSYEQRHEVLQAFCRSLAEAWATFEITGHPLEVGHAFIEQVLPTLAARANEQCETPDAQMPWLAALVCCSAFDLALHDAFGMLHERPVYDTYNSEFVSADLAHMLTPAEGTTVSFAGRFPRDYLRPRRAERLPAWHLVGGLDPISASDLTGGEPDDGHPVLLPDWIRRDGLTCLKIKLRGNDAAWDYDRLVTIGRLAVEEDVAWLTADFNCTVDQPAYVNEILDRLLLEHPRLYGMLLYVEQPFPYDLESNRIDVHSVAARKPLFMDESAHDWSLIRLGRSLGWSGVALKTCKTQTGALLSLCWARAHGMTLMVQDLTNPTLAQITHVLLAAHAPTIMGVESNGMQFYPEASAAEEAVHPGLYRRRGGQLDLHTVSGPGFGYHLSEVRQQLPAADTVCT